MKRRTAIQSLLGIPALTALPAPAAAQTKPAEPAAKLATVAPDAAAEGVRRFFTAEQFATLEKLGDLLMPPYAGKPGAKEARVPEFLDFLLSQSPSERQSLYRNGLDALGHDAQRRYSKPFSALDEAQADALLAPPFGPFLRTAQDDFLEATRNSREWATAGTSRRASGMSTYWYPVE